MLTAANTYGGGTVLSGGELGVSSEANIGAPGSVKLIFNGGRAASRRHDADTTRSMSQHGHRRLRPAGFDIVAVANTFTFSGTLSAVGQRGQRHAHSGANSYGGGTTVTGGTLRLGTAGALGSTTGALTFTAGTLDLNGNSPTVGALSGNAGAAISLGGPRSPLARATPILPMLARSAAPAGWPSTAPVRRS